MFKEVLQSIEGVGFYAIISMILFIVFFIGMTIWLLKIDKKYIKEMSELPLDDNKNEIKNLTGGTNEF